MTSFPANGKNLIISDTVHDRRLVTIKHCGRPFRNRKYSSAAAPSCGDNTMTSFRANGKT